ncbi:polyketide synthase [Nocardia brasiliensis]|uniref:Polyketide synthase n=2 Tax=Nocardia brasiliensis TaxID=37326 RepID=A0A6G9Y3Q1_NOCBR|nr:polyketide synthase [Nocardia brasiliensis]
MFKRRRAEGGRPPLTAAVLHGWLVEQIAERVNCSPADIDSAQPFENYGLDSRAAVQLSGKLEKLVEQRLSPAILFEYQTIDDLTVHLADRLQLSAR